MFSFFILEMEFRILNVNGPLIIVNITDIS